MEMVYSTGGREKYFRAEGVGDCVCRAICNATGKDYKEVYDLINKVSKEMKKDSDARNGVNPEVTCRVLEEIYGWKWVATMKFGEGCKVHLKADELPKGTIIARLSKHITCVKDGVIYDTYDCSRDGTRCVYGYWVKV